MDPLEVKHCEDTLEFLGGKRNKPGAHHGVLTFALGRAPVGEDGWEPSYPTAFLLPTLGTIPGAQQSMEIANMMQDEVIRRLNIDDKEEDEDDKYDQTAVGMFYHAWFANGKGRHVYMVHAKNPMIQEAVAAALGGDVIPLIAWEVCTTRRANYSCSKMAYAGLRTSWRS
jgi:hypothetical protein